MRGRKIDSSFVSDFIVASSAKGKDTKEAIIQTAKEQIAKIDREIRKVEQELKPKRAKLYDVLIALEEEKSKDKSIDRALLELITKRKESI